MTLLSRRQFGGWALMAGAASLGGCAPWEYADPTRGLDRLVDEPAPSPLEWRVLNRMSFGPRPADLAALRAQGIDSWIDEQLSPATIAESPDLLAALARLETMNLGVDDARDAETEWEPDQAVAPVMEKVFKFGKRRTPRPGPVRQELAQATVLRAAYSTRSLEAVMVEFWGDHFNIDQTKGDCRWLKTVDDETLRRLSLGRFRDLLGASAHSPAMLFYLDNAQNRKADSQGRWRPNENYARELLELHTLGDTSAYTLHDIHEVARALTGWSIGDRHAALSGQFVFRAADHDDDEKVVLGQRLPAGQGESDGERVLDLLARHPLTARFIVGKLCNYFLGERPAAVHDRLAEVFLQTDGDIRQVLAELFHSEEFRCGQRPRFKRPMQFTISALRALGARTSGVAIVPHLEAMGQRPFGWAQPDGYPTQPEAWSGGLLSRWNFAIALARNEIDATWINLDSLQRATRGLASEALWRQVSTCVLGVPLAGDDLRAVTDLDGQTHDTLAQGVALFLMSPQFQWS
jgi:uncharacterized protein (DUF1800 family)